MNYSGPGESVGIHLRDIRKKSNVSVHAVAKAIGVSSTVINRLEENGLKFGRDLLTVGKIAKVHGYDFSLNFHVPPAKAV